MILTPQPIPVTSYSLPYYKSYITEIISSPWGHIRLQWTAPHRLYSAMFIDNRPGSFVKIPRIDVIETPVPTQFEIDLLTALQTIPWGETVTYTRLAELCGHPKAVRPVANRLAINRVALILPCHRIVPANPKADAPYGNYRWGIDRKKSIIEFERRTIQGSYTL